jgi:aminoglycoside phosphotransferase (APT) family kinase protein
LASGGYSRALVNLTALQNAFERLLAAHFAKAVDVGSLALLAGGASRKIFGFEVTVEGEASPRTLVARMGADPGRIRGSGIDEFALLSVAAELGVMVPRVYCRGCVETTGESFYVMDRLRGDTIARKLLRDQSYAETRARLPADLARSLARVHSIDPTDPRLMSLGETGNDGDEITRYRELLELAAPGHPMPTLSLGARWLERHRPSRTRRAVVHGDFRIGNVMFDESGLTGVLDWELAHIGDPMEDLGWLAVSAWRFGTNDKPIGGLCSREEFWAHYEREGGEAVDPKIARYWEIFGNWKWAVICVMQAAGHRTSGRRDVELATIGRRVADVELELLDLLEEADRAR